MCVCELLSLYLLLSLRRTTTRPSGTAPGAPALGLSLVQVIQDRLVNPARPILDYLCQEVAVSSKQDGESVRAGREAAAVCRPASPVLS